jgi:hypothetical protein
MASAAVDIARTLSSRRATIADHPLLAETATYASEVPPEQEFGRGLDIVLRVLRGTLHGEAE